MEQRGSDMETTAMLIVAAGASSRLGRPKQLLTLQGQSLLQHTVRVAQQSTLGPVIVVLGAHAPEVRSSIEAFGVELVYNEDWQEGMAASIRCGMAHVQQVHPAVDAVILMVCDQPYVSPVLLQQLQRAHQNTGKPIITCSYADTFGPPTLFHQSLFAQLLQLTGDVGARSILKMHADRVEAIPFPEGAVDIDTDADFQNMSGQQPAV